MRSAWLELEFCGVIGASCRKYYANKSIYKITAKVNDLQESFVQLSTCLKEIS